MARAYLILDLVTAAMDGWYFDDHAAQYHIALLRREFPLGSWVLLERKESDFGVIARPGDYGIRDEFFWVNLLRDKRNDCDDS